MISTKNSTLLFVRLLFPRLGGWIFNSDVTFTSQHITYIGYQVFNVRHIMKYAFQCKMSKQILHMPAVTKWQICNKEDTW